MKSFILLASFVGTALSQTCYDGVRVLLARGTGEPQNSSVANLMSKAILAQIPDSYSNEVIYPASGDPNGVNIGVANAQSQIYDYAKACPEGKIVLMGYSQGAVVIGNAIAGAQPVCEEVGKNIVAVVLFGDPGRVLGVGMDSDVNGPSCNVSATNARTGQSLTTIETYEDRLSEWCNYDDFVCCKTGTTFAAHLSYWTNENADTVASYVSSKAASATLTSASLASTCTAITVNTATSTSSAKASTSAVASGSKPAVSNASSRISRPASGTVKPSGVGSGSASGTVQRSAVGSASATGTMQKPSTPTGISGPTTASPNIARQTTNAGLKNQAGFVGGAAAIFAGALML